MLRPVPILMYHKVGLPVTRSEDTFLNVSAGSFRRQMQAFHRLDYQALPFADVVQALICKRPLPPRTFAITFDDGYQCVRDIAAPILAEYGFPATVFAVSGWIGGFNAWDRQTGRPESPLMDWNDLRFLCESGWEIGGHTHTHPHLDTLSDNLARAEIVRGKRELEERLSVSLQTFCYPFGHFNARTPDFVREAGFTGACTTRSGFVQPRHNPFILSRIKVGYHDGLTGLLYRLLLRPYMPNLRPRRRSYRVPQPTHS